ASKLATTSLMDTFLDLLRGIQKRPAMYIGSTSIHDLQMFLEGYLFSRHQLGIEKTKTEKQFENFQKWVEEKYSIKASRSWSHIIMFFSSTPQDSFKRFYQLLDEFLEQEV
ncbi:MAG: hypothetical protein ACPG8W_04525, partial [Candidatus Promineifilaceae bacterium]